MLVLMDDTVPVLKEKYSTQSGFKLVELKENLMAAGGRNVGVKYATGEYFLFVDNDNLVYPDMIEKLVETMDSDDDIGLVGPISLNLGEKIWLASGAYNFITSRPTTLYGGCDISKVNLKDKYDTCYSPNIMMISKAAMQEVGGFDKSYYAMYEEADIGYRIKKAGYKEYIISAAKTNHMGYVRPEENEVLRRLGINFPERAFNFAKNRTVFMKKYAPRYCMIGYFLFFIHAFAIYYSITALKYGRNDIAKAWVKGTYTGLLKRVLREIKVEL